MLQGGRWNSPGKPVICAALSYAGAILEQLVHASTGRMPRNQQYVVISVPAKVRVEKRSGDNLASGWDQADCLASRAFGDEWLASERNKGRMTAEPDPFPAGRPFRPARALPAVTKGSLTS